MSRTKPKVWRDQFVKMPVAFLQHPAFRTLPGSAARWLMELASRHNGRNNGELFLSQREAKRLLGLTQDGYERARTEAETRKLAVKTSEGDYMQKKSPTWRLTFIADNGDIPTNEYRLWTPDDRIKFARRR